MEKLLFPTLAGKWKSDIQLNKYAKLLFEDIDWNDFTTNPFLDPNLFGEWINLLHKTFGVDYSWGGWMEDREEILNGTYLLDGKRVHLGVDFWVPEDISVHLPKEGKLVHARIDPDMNGGWGGQVIFEIDGLHYIFGHLKDIVVTTGKVYPKGTTIGYVAEVEGSGGWYPHLHVQCMKKFDESVDGYGSRDPFRFENFPNPVGAIML